MLVIVLYICSMDLKALTPTQRAKIELAARAITEAMCENVNSLTKVTHGEVMLEILNQTPHTLGLSYLLIKKLYS